MYRRFAALGALGGGAWWSTTSAFADDSHFTRRVSRSKNSTTSAAFSPLSAGGHHRDAVELVSVAVASYAANDPVEDRAAVGSVRGLPFFSVLDGHGGWHVAQFAQRRLPAAIEEALPAGAVTDAAVQKALVDAFERTDAEFVAAVKPAFDLGFGAVSRVGACAIAALVCGPKLFVANAGDCRAVLLRPRPDTAGSDGDSGGDAKAAAACALEAFPLSRDHNAKIISEQARLAFEHPGEEDIVKCKRPDSCYVKGKLQPTRSLGDLNLKLPAFNGDAAPPPGCTSRRRRQRDIPRHMPPPFTPPYISESPEVVSVDLKRTLADAGTGAGAGAGNDGKRDVWVVLATDGLWDHLTNDDVAAEVAGHHAQPPSPLPLAAANAAAEVRAAEADAAAGAASDAATTAGGDFTGAPIADGELGALRGNIAVLAHAHLVDDGAEAARNVAQRLVERSLANAAAHRGVAVADLRVLPQGRARRRKHDDITVVVARLRVPR